MKKNLKLTSEFLLLIGLCCGYFWQLDHYAKRYYLLYLNQDFSFDVNEKITEWRTKEAEKEIASLGKELSDIRDNYYSNRNGKNLLSDIKQSLKDGNVERLNKHKSETSEEFIEGIKPGIKMKQVSGDLDELIQFTEVRMKESTKKYEILNDRMNTSLEKRKLILTKEDFEYFSLVTSTTTGYGDITPVHTKVRNLVRDQVMISLILSGLIISLLAGLIAKLFAYQKSVIPNVIGEKSNSKSSS